MRCYLCGPTPAIRASMIFARLPSRPDAELLGPAHRAIIFLNSRRGLRPKVQPCARIPAGSRSGNRKREVQCRAGTISAFFGREPGQTWAKTGFVRIIVQGGSKRDERLADVPTVYELMEKQKTPEAIKRLARVLLSPADIGRPIVGTPGIPADQIKLLRTAFLKALSDAELLAEAKKGDGKQGQ